MASPYASQQLAGQLPPRSMDASLVAMGDSALGTQMDSFFKHQKPGPAPTFEDSFSINDRREDPQTFKPPAPPQDPGAITMAEYWQSAAAQARPDLAISAPRLPPGKSKPRSGYSGLAEREKAEAYFDLYDRNQKLQKSHNALEGELRQLTTKLMKIEKDVKAERTLTESYTGFKAPPAAQAEIEAVKRENETLKTRLGTLTKAIRDGSIKQGKHSLLGPHYTPANENPRVLPASGSETVKAEELVLIEKLRTQVLILERELQRYRAKPMAGTMPPALTETVTKSSMQMGDLERSLKTMEEGFMANKRFYEQTKAELDETRTALAAEKAKVSDLQVKLRVANMGSEGANDMARKIDELTRENRNLENQIKDLCASPFIKEAGDRVMNRTRLLSFEQELKAKADTIARLTDIGTKLETEVKRLTEDLIRISAERDKNREEYLKAIVRLEERERSGNPLDAQFSALKGGTDNSDFEKAMRLMNLRGEEPAWGRLDFLERARVVPEDVPTLQRELERLRLEKSQLIAELEKTQRLLTLRNELDKDQKSAKTSEMEGLRMQLKAAQQRAEELARLADFRANRLIQLEKNQRLNLYDDQSHIIASKTEIRLGDLVEGAEFVTAEIETEVGSGENILDLYLGEGEFYPIRLTDVLGTTQELVTFLTVDFYNHETQVSNVCTGLKPFYNIHISFKVTVDDGFLEYLEKGYVALEAVATKEQGQMVLGGGKIMLLELIKRAGTGYVTSDHGVVIEGMCSLQRAGEAIATVGVCKYKLRMRHPLSEALRWYREREEIVSVGHPLTYLLDKVTRLEERSEVKKRALEVRVERCASLTPSPGLPTQPAVFVSYQFPGVEPVYTATKAGLDPVFSETRTIELPLSSDFQRFLDMGSLEVLVFDDNIPAKGEDLMGVAKVPLSNLLLDMPVDGTFTLYGRDGRPAGVVVVEMHWQDMRSAADSSKADVLERDLWQRIATNLKTRGLTIESAFNIFDQDQDGLVSAQEFRNSLLITLRVQMTEQEIQLLLNLLPMTSGALAKTEFKAKLQGLLPLGTKTQEAGAWEESILDRVKALARGKNLSLKATFDAFDINNSGFIEAEEFQRTFQIMQLGLSEEEVTRLFAYFDPGPEAKVSYQRFMERMLVESSSKADPGSPQEIVKKVGLLMKESKMQLRQAFAVFDQNQDGKISRVEFVKVFEMMKLGLTAAEIETVWGSVKKDAQGFLNYIDFCAVFESSADPSQDRPTFPALRQRIVTVLKTKNISARPLLVGFDKDRDGMLGRDEFREALESLRINLSTYDIEVLLDTADRNRDGRISLQEWCELIEPRPNPIDAFRSLLRASKLTQADVFSAMDQNRDGFISGQEFRDAMIKLNLGLTLGEIDDMIRLVDANKDGRLDYREFMRLVVEPGRQGTGQMQGSIGKQTESTLKRPPEAEIDILKEVVMAISQSRIPLRDAFSVFDKDKDGSISTEEFRQVLVNMQIQLSPAQISQLLQRIDVNRDGKLSYEEFRKLFSAYGVPLTEPVGDLSSKPSQTVQSSLTRKR